LKSKLDAIGVPLVPIVVPAPQENKAIVASGGGFVYLMMGPAENETAFVNQLNDYAKQVNKSQTYLFAWH